MSKNAIDVDHVSIRFNLANEKVNNLKEYTIKLIKHELMFQEFLALKDVNLHVKSGEAWGLIGTNGSGKSTLLKTIAGILKPYTGTVKVRGSIAPMIELGAGFDAELTARENIFCVKPLKAIISPMKFCGAKKRRFLTRWDIQWLII